MRPARSSPWWPWGSFDRAGPGDLEAPDAEPVAGAGYVPVRPMTVATVRSRIVRSSATVVRIRWLPVAPMASLTARMRRPTRSQPTAWPSAGFRQALRTPYIPRLSMPTRLISGFSASASIALVDGGRAFARPRRRGDRQDPTDGLDPARTLVLVDEAGHHGERRPSPLE